MNNYIFFIMKFILIVVFLSTLVLASTHATVYGIFREDCFGRFLAFDFDIECIKFTFLKSISFAIIAGSVFFKVP